MKYALRALLLLAMAWSTCIAQAPERTSGSPNGRYWQTLSPMSKICFLEGFQTGFRAGHLHGSGMMNPGASETSQSVAFGALRADFSRYWPAASPFTFGEMISALDLLYKDPANLILSVNSAMMAATFRANGAAPEDVEGMLAGMRATSVKSITDDERIKDNGAKGAGKNP